MPGNMRTPPLLFCCSLCIVLLVAGCGRPHPASVSGTVTLDGKPLTHGTVAFHPVSGGAIAYAGIHPDGAYKVSTGTDQGLDAGEYVVTVVAAGAPPAGGRGESVENLLTPLRYANPETSNLRFNVTASAQRIDLPLTSL